MKITIGQFEPLLGDKIRNLTMMKKIMQQAAYEKSDLVLFPELCLTGYFIQDLDEQVAEPVDGPSVKCIQDLCVEFSVYTIFAWPELKDNKVYNSACLINDRGRIVGVYRKIHIYGREKEIFSPGNEFKVFKTEIGKIGIMICFDLDFPESARMLNMKDADIILVPTNNFLPYERYQETYMKSRSMENEIPMAICNRIGKEQDLEYFGESAVYDAHGHQLIKLNQIECAKTVEVLINQKRDSNLGYKQERMPKTYEELTRIGE